MHKAIRFHEVGGPEVLTWEDVEVVDPSPGEVRIRHEAVGVNFVDINQRYHLRDAAQAHIDLESRKTTGSSILLPR